MTDAALHDPLTPPGRRRSAKPDWFDPDGPALLGQECTSCRSVCFPPTSEFCQNPACEGEQFASVRLSNRGTVWSATTNHYQPPAPAISPEPFDPYTVVAVELAAEELVVLGQLSTTSPRVAVGDEVRLVSEPLLEDEDGVQLVWRWTRVAGNDDKEARS